jgi:hypothetical protein
VKRFSGVCGECKSADAAAGVADFSQDFPGNMGGPQTDLGLPPKQSTTILMPTVSELDARDHRHLCVKGFLAARNQVPPC